LIPQTEERSGIGKDSLEFMPEAVDRLIKDYAREAGVRQLGKLLEKVSRKVALNKIRKKDGEEAKAVVSLDNLTTYVGQPMFASDRLYERNAPPGVVMGLAWTAMGGATLYIEAIGHGSARGIAPSDDVEFVADAGQSDNANDDEMGDMDQEEKKKKPKDGGGGGGMKVTGQLGEVMSESTSISLTYARLFTRELNTGNRYLENTKIHLNVPEGGIPKDGPSAGVTMATSLMSLAFNTPVKADLAMTGELTLSGKVLRVGGIKEKLIAARREGVTTILMPRLCQADFTELKPYLKEGMTVHFVDHYDDVYKLAFDTDSVPPLPFASRGLTVETVETAASTDAAEQPVAQQPVAEQPVAEQAQ